ncbi:MAG TPA: TetR/AcrR family transcriptional regulator [Acidimicrobiales bacterium]|nr:TetR/AcrR family transcriptional regulator [Acidimicrobiales bacterium]
MSVSAPQDLDGRRDRWREHRERRRREFVDAALRVLAAQGPELAMDAVAAEAGISKPVLYRYFHDKAALVQALDQRGGELLFARLLPTLTAEGPARAGVQDAVAAYFEVIDEHPNLYWLIARKPPVDGSGGPGPAEEHRAFIAATLASLIDESVRLFDLDPAGSQPWAQGITGAVQATGEWWLRTRAMSRSQVVGYVTQMVWAALSGVLRDAGVVVDPDLPWSAGRRAATP